MAELLSMPPAHIGDESRSASFIRICLERPRSRLRELLLTVRAVRDLIQGFRTFPSAGPCVTVFGSARCPPEHPYYGVGREIGRRLTEIGFTVMTGGGPGLMEAVNRGARDAGGRSVACKIQLPNEQSGNPYLDRSVSCQHFFVRKVLLFKYSYAFIALPGGLGTMDELFEALTLVQTRKVENFPIVLIGTAYWQPVLDLLNRMVSDAMIDPSDLQLAMVTDDLDETIRHIQRCTVERFGLRLRSQPNPSRLIDRAAAMTPASPKAASGVSSA